MKKILLAIMILMLLTPAAGIAGNYCWVACQPDSRVNVREKPNKKSKVVGVGYLGDRLEMDGETSGEWVHCIVACDAGEGWIRADYLVMDKPDPDVGTGIFEVTENRVLARKSRGGDVRKKLNAGQWVEVYMVSPEWSVTSEGFVRTEYLVEVPESKLEEVRTAAKNKKAEGVR